MGANINMEEKKDIEKEQRMCLEASEMRVGENKPKWKFNRVNQKPTNKNDIHQDVDGGE